jgi:thioredoxin-like negative regulator of GroEL
MNAEALEKLVLMKANLDDVPKTAGKFGVESIPTVILFKNGQTCNSAICKIL